jgi:hypothetical protein
MLICLHGMAYTWVEPVSCVYTFVHAVHMGGVCIGVYVHIHACCVHMHMGGVFTHVGTCLHAYTHRVCAHTHMAPLLSVHRCSTDHILWII